MYLAFFILINQLIITLWFRNLNVTLHLGKRKKQTYFISCLFAVWGTCGLAPGTQCRLQCHSSSAAAQTWWAAFPFLLGPRVCRMCANSWLQTASLRYLCGALHVTGLLLAPSLGELGRPFLHHRWSLAHILQPRRDIEACHWDPKKKKAHFLPPSRRWESCVHPVL